jgi:hypothetical protein
MMSKDVRIFETGLGHGQTVLEEAEAQLLSRGLNIKASEISFYPFSTIFWFVKIYQLPEWLALDTSSFSLHCLVCYASTF